MPDPGAVPYPETRRDRDGWILERRPPRQRQDARQPQDFFLEEERSESGDVVPVASIFLTNRECPWRCLMCDLWRHTLEETVPSGAIPEQIDRALSRLGPARHVKVYNSGSFFDPKAVPPEEYPAIAARLRNFERVIVECHPALVGGSCARFRDLLPGRLEVAMGLETAHPDILPRLNKGMTLEMFAAASEKLRAWNIAVRVFILVKPPFLEEGEAVDWTGRSLDFAFACGASVAVLIPTRDGNGAMETLREQGAFAPPRLATLENALADGLAKKRGRVFADLWDVGRIADCQACFPARKERLQAMNARQETPPSIACAECGGRS